MRSLRLRSSAFPASEGNDCSTSARSGQMTGDRLEPPHAVRAEPLAQCIDQDGATFGSPSAAGSSAINSFLPRRHLLGAGDRKPDRLEAETGVSHCRQRLELQIEEAHDMRDIAGRQGEPDIDGLDRAVDVVERQPQRAGADIVAREYVHEDCMSRRASAMTASWVKIGSSR